MIFILNEETGFYNGYIPDLTIFCEGETLESVYVAAEELMSYYFNLAVKHQTDVPPPSTMEAVSQKWTGYKVSLITASVK
jgi:predicted RNase H-like HicB family nuclease